jgi:5-methylcytosine-specific restriction endonuclease McrA
MSTQDHVELGIKVIGLLDSASYATTYKMATFLGLMDVIKESVSSKGTFPSVIKGSDVCDKVFEIYWKQSVPYASALTTKTSYLRQSPQRDIPQIIAEYRAKNSQISKGFSIANAFSMDPDGMAKLQRDVRQRVLKMPLPRLQKLGGKDNWKEDRFLFDLNWEEDKLPSDDSLYLKDGAAESLMKIRPLLRPYIEALWSNFVAERNSSLTDAAKLRSSLFGATRTNTVPLRKHLRSLQNGKCFYCDGSMTKSGDIDHFFAFTHFNNEDLDNFVLSCSTCNRSKSAMLPSLSHLGKLLKRNKNAKVLDEISQSLNWPRGTHQVRSLANLAYLVETNTILWHAPGKFQTLNLAKAIQLLK